MQITLRRMLKTEQATIGHIDLEGQRFYTLEPAWKDNIRNISCIPLGDYRCNYLPRSFSGKYRKTWHIRHVTNRSGILIHTGNIVSHTKGCILLGTRLGFLYGQAAVLLSRSAMRTFNSILDKESFTLSII